MKYARVVALFAGRSGMALEDALAFFYTSRTRSAMPLGSSKNERLHDEHTGLYLMSDHYLVDEVIRELRNEARAESK